MSPQRPTAACLLLLLGLLATVACTSKEESRFKQRSHLDERARAAQEHRAGLARSADAALDEAVDELPPPGGAAGASDDEDEEPRR